MSKKALKNPRCPQCGEPGEILWQIDRGCHSHLKEPVLVFKMPDGSYSFPATNQAKTPQGAERMELTKAGEVRVVLRDYNRMTEAKDRAQEERYMEVAQAQQDERRARLHHLMGQESDPAAKDLYREALERAKYEEAPRYREFYHELLQ
jgi:hypothetical protein